MAAISIRGCTGTMDRWMECVKSGRVWYREHRVRGADGLYHAIPRKGCPSAGKTARLPGAGINPDIGRMKLTEEGWEADQRKDGLLPPWHTNCAILWRPYATR
jgi:hypothetical protein